MPGVGARSVAPIVFSLLVGAAPALVILGSRPAGPANHVLEVSIASEHAGVLQVFFDRGRGIQPDEMSAIAVLDSDEPITYQVPLPAGTYRLFRLDPNNRPGPFTIASLRILETDGDLVTTLPLDRLVAAHQAAIQSRDASGVHVVTTRDANDPQLLLEPAVPLDLTGAQPAPHEWPSRALAVFVVVSGAALIVIVLLGRLRHGASRAAAAREWFRRWPRATVAAAAVAGALLATYPLLAGRSLVSPNNGGTALLYDHAPFVPGSRDTVVEDQRGTDVGAMMWAILPYTTVQREALRHGEWALWNRYNKGGEPLWGQGQSFALDPLHVASLFVPDAALAMDLRFIAARAVFAAGAGLVTLALTGSLGAAVLIAVVTPFIGTYTMRLNHPAYFSLTYAPWVLLGYVALSRAVTRGANARAAAGIAVASWLQLVGSTPKEGIVALAAVHAAGFLGIMLVRRSWSDRLASLDMLCIAGVATVLASAPHWLIFLDTLSRSFTNYDRPAVLVAGWPDVVAFVFGAATPGFPRPGVHALLAGLAIVGVLRLRSLWRNPVALGAVVAALLFWAIALGVVPTSLMVRVPLVANIHHVGFAFAAATIPLVLAVAGVGAAALMDPSTPRRVSIGLGAVAAVVSVLLFREVMATTAPLPAELMTFWSLAGAIAVIGVAPLASPTSRLSWSLAMMVGVAAAVMAGGLAWDTGDSTIDSVLMQPRPRVDLQRISPALEPVVRASSAGEPFRVAPVGTVMFPGTQAYWGLEGVGGPDAVRLPLIEELSDISGVERTNWVWLTLLGDSNLPMARGYLDMLNVRFLVARHNQLPHEGTLLRVEDEDLVRVIERSTWWPRAFFVDGIERHDSVLAFASRLRDATAPFVSVDRSDADALSAVATLPSHASTMVRARDYHLTVNRTAFRVDAPGPGVIALSEAFVEHDFVATLNGEQVPYFRINHALKGIAIPGAGTWEVAFEYRPRFWRLSWLMAAAGWLAITGLIAGGLRERDRAESIDGRAHK